MHAAITAVGVDRPGIVAAVTKLLYEAGGNIEDSRMAILGGHFAVVLIAALPDDADLAALEGALREATAGFDLIVSARPVAEAPPEHAEGTPYTFRVYGGDRPGIVAGMSAVLAEHRVNIRDLATHLAGDPPVYVMILDVVYPSGADAASIESALKARASSLGVDISIEQAEPETF